ncbi:NADH dehydrogenase (ubiquinone) complex I, assembly factor 6 [Iris pallida]|uniref:NADH dehydrogenase (Ubiquinone) complex I, assembly factor 6 n=1 Tax=Iris pallida TaxID=29817 RepID=A0AAX6F861_IRIPA|nr:NADH dehydrogenase (ubiquinone) complex I, assembly factor 6 [Iris pallida]
MTLQAGGIHSTAPDHAASYIGKASGLLLLLKSLSCHLNRTGSITYIPLEVACKHGLLPTIGDGLQEIKMESGEDLFDAVFEMASMANAHLEKARVLAPTVPVEAVHVLLPAVSTQVLLDSLRRRLLNVFDSRLAQGILEVSPLWF